MKKILVVENRKAQLVDATKVPSEAVLQTYLEQFPSLLPIWEVDENAPPLLTIGREVGVPFGSVDLLFTDANGLLTVVETKLARNSEARREVIGQVIEYASFLSAWDADRLERQANDYLRSQSAPDDYRGLDLYEALSKLGGDVDVPAEAFREGVEDNLKRGHIRLVIAVDENVEPLKSTVTFLNRLSPFDILVLQIADFKESEARHVLIPSLFGYSPPPPPPPPTWDEKSFFEDAEKHHSPAELRVIRGLYDLTVGIGTAQFGRGTKGSFTCRVSSEGRRRFSLFIVFNGGGIQLGFGDLRSKGIPEKIRLEFLNRLNTIPGISLPEGLAAATAGKYPATIPFQPLTQGEALERFSDAIRWLREQVLSSEPTVQAEDAPDD